MNDFRTVRNHSRNGNDSRMFRTGSRTFAAHSLRFADDSLTDGLLTLRNDSLTLVDGPRTLRFAANANAAALGLVVGDLTDINAAQTVWDNTYQASNTAQASAQAATLAKDGAREVFEPLLRSLAQGLQISPTVTDVQRKAMQLPIRSTTRTRASVPTTKSLATIDTSQRLAQLIDFRDADSPQSKAKPDGIMGCEIWMKLGDTPPVDPSELSFVTLDTNTPYLNQLTGAQAGKKAHYMLRWVNTRGEKGPWSDTASATVTG